eukprot:TRINITY_DN2028_c1_g2_i1.p2 TRINITY_DN2028_c1_g2~~TRINITY_DN2028_c1_g2_i1.p2  ORF type:complete len:115 (-),score=26.37 TRINITY_DN2028_c1_g2_i1:48-392(-)
MQLDGEDDHILVFETEKEGIVGFICCQYQGESHFYVDSFHVLPEKRGMGFGGKAWRMLVERVGKEGNSMHLLIVEDNELGKKFYERNGGVCEDEVVEYDLWGNNIGTKRIDWKW